MGKTVNKAMTFEEIPLSKPSKQAVKKQRERSTNVKYMPSYEIVWFLVYKHRVGLLFVSNALLGGWLVVR